MIFQKGFEAPHFRGCFDDSPQNVPLYTHNMGRLHLNLYILIQHKKKVLLV